jgi:ATP-binding cassette subfamily F protein 3
VIHLRGLSKGYGSKVLFEDAEAHLGYRSRAALVGPNGAGKSTLIRILLGEDTADAGTITRAKGLSIGHLAQDVPKFTDRTVLGETLRMDGRREGLDRTRRELEESFSKGNTDESDLAHYGRVLEELELLDENRIEARAKEILGGMGFRPADFERSLAEFSGGWLMRVALARVLLSEPDLLLLDEPTNHLDLESLLWLEEYLTGYRGALLLVSHDTEFLNRMVHEVLEIDQRKLWTYRGNIEAYRAQKEERLAVLKAQHAGQQARIAEIEDFVARFGAKATKARQAQSRLKELDRMDRIELPEERATVRFRFPPAPHSGREVVTVRRARVAYGEKTVFKDLDWVIQRGKRVAIVGPNGAGKTTLLKVLAGTLRAADGEVRLGHQVRVGYYAQLQAETLNLERTILQELEAVAPEMPIAQLRAIAGAFLFSGDAVEKKCAVLSGGEKARVALARLLLSPSNFLLLDEPTNHLDVESRGMLLEALKGYEGTLCLVSHDRAFVSPLVDSVLEIEPAPGGSRVHHRVGSYDDYVARKMGEASRAFRATLAKAPVEAEAGSVPSPKAAPARTGPSNNQRRAWERERDKLTEEITVAERRQAEVHTALADDAVYADKPRLDSLLDEQRRLSETLGQKLSRWEELCLLLGD